MAITPKSAWGLAEQHDEWTEMRRYIGLDILSRCRQALAEVAEQPGPRAVRLAQQLIVLLEAAGLPGGGPAPGGS